MILTQRNIFWKCVFLLAGFNLCFSLIAPAVTRIYVPHRVRSIAAGNNAPHSWWMNDTRVPGSVTAGKCVVQRSGCGDRGVIGEEKPPYFFRSRVNHLPSFPGCCWAPWLDDSKIRCVHSLGSSSVLQLHPMDLDDWASTFSIFQMWPFVWGPKLWRTGLWLAALSRQKGETALNSFRWFWWLLLCFFYIPSFLNGISH